MNIKDKDSQFLARDADPYPLQIVHAEGSYIIDSENKKYVDFTSAWCVGNLGWNNREIKEELNKFDGPDYVDPNFIYQPWADLAELLAQITPGDLSKCFRATGGSEAVELALRTANAYTKRAKFLSFEGSYHGDTIGAISVGGSLFKEHQPGLLNTYPKITPPVDKNTLIEIEKLLQKKDIAAFIMEPILLILGVIIPEAGFMTKLQELCTHYGTLLIIDEVGTGFGRTGALFGAEHYEITPDIMCLAKAITGGYGPMGAMITTSKVAKAMEYEYSYYSTYGWYPRSVAAALINIRYLLKYKETLMNHVAQLSTYFAKRLDSMEFLNDCEINIKGAAIGVRFKDRAQGHIIAKKALSSGLLISPTMHGFNLFPALNMTEAVAEEGLDILESCFAYSMDKEKHKSIKEHNRRL